MQLNITFGVIVYRLRFIPLSAAAAWSLAIGAPLVLTSAMWLGLNHVANDLSHWFLSGGGHYANEFVRNWFVAAAFAVHLLGVHSLEIPLPTLLRQMAAKLADMSFSLYLLHYPLLVISAFYIINTQTNFALVEMTVAVFAMCYLLSVFTEGKRQQIKSLLVSAY